MRRALKACIAQPSFTAAEDNDAFVLIRNLILIASLDNARNGANRHFKNRVSTVRPMLQLALPVLAIFSMEFFLIAIVRERRDIAHAEQNDITASAAVAAGRPAARRLLGAQPADDAVAALSRRSMDSYLICKRHCIHPNTNENMKHGLSKAPNSKHEIRNKNQN